MAAITLPYTEPHSHPPDKEDEESSKAEAESGTLLVDHLRDVGGRAERLAGRGGEPTVTEIARIAGELHDFGKVTPYFQYYIAKDPKGDPVLKNHSPLGALAVYHVLDERGYSEEIALVGLIAIAKHHGILPNVAEYVNDTALGAVRGKTITKQLKAIDMATRETADEILTRASDGATDWAAFYERASDGTLQAAINDQITGRKGQLSETACSETFYDWIMQIWGALVIADKTSAAGIPTAAYGGTHAESKAVQTHVDKLQAEAKAKVGPEGIPPELRELNDYRDQARGSIVRNGHRIARAANGAGWIGEITLPTGLGKTLAALHLAHVIGEEQDEATRIIYALPYTSIIDQTATVIEDVFDADKTGDELTIHYHLEEVVTTIDEYEKRREALGRDPDEYAHEEYLAAKGWNSGMTLTTFVQLFESLVRPSNQQAMKLPSLYNSVIILDEPQTLPLDWWRLIRRLVETITEEYNATVISMTATQPKILTASTCEFDVHQLVDDPDQYFELVERVEYQYDHSLEAYLEDPETENTRTHMAASEMIIGNITADEPTGLAICNTVKSARQLIDEVGRAAADVRYNRVPLGDVYAPIAKRNDDELKRDEDDDRNEETITECRARLLLEALESELGSTANPLVTLQLTTRHRPKDRKVLLEAASELSGTRDVPFVFIATQLVEAGVDVSFTRVYRDIAPISSIVQAAGRCNRSALRDRGTVTIWRLEPTNKGKLPPSEYTYGMGENSKLGPTARALRTVAPTCEGSEIRTVPEIAVARDGVIEYYEILDCERDVGKQAYVDQLEAGKFAELRELSLIEEREQYDTLVCRSPAESATATELLRAARNGKTALALEHLSELEDTQVALPESVVDGGRPAESEGVEIGTRAVYVVDAYAGSGAFSACGGLIE